MDIYVDGTKFGLEIPELTASLKKMKSESFSQQSREENIRVQESKADLIRQVGTFLMKNSAGLPLGGVSIGLIAYDASLQNIPVGVTFYGTEALAQKLADAFPDYKVIDAQDGKVFTPTQIATPKSAKPKPGPRP